MSMSISYEQRGRQDQKQRTRQALITAARDLLAQGATPTVEAAAAAASISRATAYRYFPNQHSLLVGAHPEVDVNRSSTQTPHSSPRRASTPSSTAPPSIMFSAEATYRTMLRLSLEADPAARGDLALRKGLRLRWIEDALEPVRNQLPSDDFRRLVHAIAVDDLDRSDHRAGRPRRTLAPGSRRGDPLVRPRPPPISPRDRPDDHAR